ncbi:hypothetical protein GWI33_009415 [Rhynchophorus ferrugineus]|uniref:Uncharacterized protein n=1 Tax=Rhynchophorus ferrugineus TaxID=354439 RepID=A0A834IFU6_RHYFE|nr:hypothetical protein GWI33_009415 [Rhynchophorus ferrugineus]
MSETSQNAHRVVIYRNRTNRIDSAPGDDQSPFAADPISAIGAGRGPGDAPRASTARGGCGAAPARGGRAGGEGG